MVGVVPGTVGAITLHSWQAPGKTGGIAGVVQRTPGPSRGGTAAHFFFNRVARCLYRSTHCFLVLPSTSSAILSHLSFSL